MAAAVAVPLVAAGGPAAGAGGGTEVTPSGWPLDASSYDLQCDIGQGAFARVAKAYCAAKQADVAVKIISLERVNTSMQDIQGEVRAMRLARHANVLELHCAFVVDADLWLVMPLMDKGSAYYIMRALRARSITREGEGLAEAFVRVILREVLQGLVYLHSNGQVHRDIKAGNILVNSEGQVKVGDFGVAGWLNEYSASRMAGKATTFVGTLCWMAPEVMEKTKGYATAVDIWSLGITALELAKGVAPYSHLSAMQVLIKTLREDAPSLDTYEHTPGMAKPALSSGFKAFVTKCLDKNPEKRPTAAALLKDKYIKNAPKLEELVTGLLPNVPTVGGETAALMGERPVGYAPVTLTDAGDESQYVPGTTWRFPGEEPLPSAGGGTADHTAKASAEDVSAAVAELVGLGATGASPGDSDEEDEEDDE